MVPASDIDAMTAKDQSSENPPRLLLSKREAADALNISIRHLESLLRASDPPPHVRLGSKMIQFPVTALDGWIARRTVNAGGAR